MDVAARAAVRRGHHRLDGGSEHGAPLAAKAAVILLRSALFNLYFFGLTFVLAVGGVFVRLFAPEQTLDYARFWVRLILAGLRRICGIYVVVTGSENLPEAGPALIASQHQS